MILDAILAHKKQEVAIAKTRVPLVELQAKIAETPAPRGFAAVLKQQAEVGTAIIAEVKKGSPSKGIIRSDFEPVTIARGYEQAGAACLSVLTDNRYFHGELNFLPRIAEVVSLPLLRKEFIVDPYQIYEARAHRADAILLITAALSRDELQEFSELAGVLGMDVLLEVHDEAELKLALTVPSDMIGINNRNLKTFHTDLATTERLLPRISAEKIVVAESGISNRADIIRLTRAGAQAFLIGESLMRETDFQAKLKSLLQD